MKLFNPFTWYSEYRLAKLKLELDAKNKPFEMISAAVQSQSQFIKEYFGSFRTTELPSSNTIRDEDEFNREVEQAYGGVNPGVASSIRNAIKAGAMPELKDILGIQDN
jgi:hypothetical protein